LFKAQRKAEKPMTYKTRKFTIALADAGDGLELTPSNLGFNPSHGHRKVQITTNNFGGTFSLDIRPIGSSLYIPFVIEGDAATGGTDAILAGRDVDLLFDSLKLGFQNATGDIDVYLGFIES
jgi:hypothetical protein